MKFEKVLLPVDFSDHSDNLLKVAISFAKSNNSTLSLVHIVSTDLYVSSFYSSTINLPNIIIDIVAEAKVHMESFVGRFDFQGVPFESKVIEGNVHKAIYEEAETMGADLIIMGTHGRSGIEHMVLGSTAERVIREAPCPVMTIKHDVSSD